MPTVARIEQPPPTTLGMCGYPSPYDPVRVAAAVPVEATR
jgi:hypothetical protein